MFNYYPLTEENSKIDIDPVELVNVEQLLTEIEQLGGFSEDFSRASLTNWNKALRKATGNELSLALKLAGPEKESHQIIFNTEGLINEFASLKTIKDIELFSLKYGLLGVKPPDSEQVNSPYLSVQATIQPSYIFNDYGFSVLEPIELWLWHIDEVRKILKLYDVVRKDSSEDRVNQIIEIKINNQYSNYLDEDRESMDYFVHWTAGKAVIRLPKEISEKTLLEIGQYTLSKILESRIAGGVNLGTGGLVRNPSTKGFKVIERRYTHYLLAAIYYDLWQNINDDKNIYICGNKNCGSPFIKSGRKKYCNEACKQEAYRIRLEEKKGRDNL